MMLLGVVMSAHHEPQGSPLSEVMGLFDVGAGSDDDDHQHHDHHQEEEFVSPPPSAPAAVVVDPPMMMVAAGNGVCSPDAS